MSPFSNVKKLWRFVALHSKDHKYMLPALCIYGLSASTMTFISLVFSSAIMDDVIAADFEMAGKRVLWMLSLLLILGIVSKLNGQMIKVWVGTLSNDLNEKLMDKMFSIQYQKAQSPETLEFIRQIRSNIQASGSSGALLDRMASLLVQIWTCIYALVFIVILFTKIGTGQKGFLNSWAAVACLGVLIGGGCLGCYFIQKLCDQGYQKMQKKNRRNNTAFSYVSQLLFDYENSKDIHIFKLYPLIKNIFERFQDNGYTRWACKNGGCQAAMAALIQLCAAFSYIYVGGRAIYGAISVGSVLLYAGSINRFSDSIQKCIAQFGECQYILTYISQVQDFLKLPDMDYEGTLPVEKGDDARYEIEFEDVCFKYPGTTEPVLDHVSLRFEIGKKIALVGRNGAGKTTLIKLLCRLYAPDSGRILLNGVDIRYYNYQEYTDIFSVVFQDFNLFSLPVRENIAGGSRVDTQRMWKALDEAGMQARVLKMENGTDTILYNYTGTGVDISGGEAQKLALARALYKDAPFVILDEPTAALDPIAEAEVYSHFNDMIRNKTAVYISHRMSSCRFCDEILVLDHGKIRERGDHETLMAKQGIYASLFNIQAQYYAFGDENGTDLLYNN